MVSLEEQDMGALESQLAEVEVLTSMYSLEGEMELDDPSVLVDLRALLEAPATRRSFAEAPRRLGFTLNLMTALKNRIEIVVTLPRSYPRVPADVCVRCSGWTRARHSRFSDALQAALRDFSRAAEPCLHEIVRWALDNADEYIEDSGGGVNSGAGNSGCGNSNGGNSGHGNSDVGNSGVGNSNGGNSDENSKNLTKRQNSKPPNATSEGDSESSGFTRLWIYSHHIYNTAKRRTIVDAARELDLTGFSVAGKPGLICVEGDRGNAEEFWRRIRALPWQRIGVRHREDTNVSVDSANATEMSSPRRFERFEEKSFEARQTRGRMARADFGLLFQFLQERGFGELFRVYFGVDGKGAETREGAELAGDD